MEMGLGCTRNHWLTRHQACVNCHFLIQLILETGGTPLLVTSQSRDSIRNHDYSWIAGSCILACYLGVWNEAHIHGKLERNDIIVKTNRKNKCFFRPYQNGMHLDAAKILQERKARDRESSRDRKLTIFGLFIAAIALVLTFLKDVGLLDWIATFLH
jgi:hypothetical protein